MGYSVLYIAFGIVALWLLGEVLLQYKARLRWRILAFAGFLGVVGGVALHQVALIVLGAVAFGTGQSFVTLSYKRGFSTGWALGGRPGSSRRRRGGAAGERPATEPVLEVTPVEEDLYPAADAYRPADEREDQLAAGQGAPIYQPVPMHDESGEYPLYSNQSSYTSDPYTSGGYEGYGAQGYGEWGAEPQPAAAGSYASYDSGGQQDGTAYGTGGFDQQNGWGGQDYTYGQTPYQEQPAAQNGYDTYGYGGQGAGDWQSQTPYPQAGRPAADAYGGAYGYDQQPYVPQQQAPYEQQQTYAGEPAAEYADPYDPYRY